MDDYRFKWFALIGLSILAFIAFLDFTVVNTALPAIHRSLHTNVIKLQWIINIYALIGAIFLIISGKVGDIFGRRKTFYIAVIIFGLAALGAGLASDINWVIIFRALQALGASAIYTIGAALLPQAVPEKDMTKAIGIYSAITGVGLAIGPFFGGVLVSLLTWRWVFFINIPFIIAGFILCSFSLKKDSSSSIKQHIDWWGALFIIIGIGSLVYGMIRGEQYGWHLPTPWLLVVIGVLGLTTLIVIEKKQKHPLLDLSIFKNTHLVIGAVIAGMAGVVSCVFMFFDPLYLSVVRDLNPFMVGLSLIAMPIMQIILSSTFPFLHKKLTVSKLILFAIAATLIAALMHTTFSVNTHYWFIIISFLLLGMTWGMGNTGAIYMANKYAHPDHIGSVIGTVFTFWNVCGSFFLTTSIVIFHSQHSSVVTHLKNKLVFLQGLHWVGWYISIVCFIVLLYTFYLQKKN